MVQVFVVIELTLSVRSNSRGRCYLKPPFRVTWSTDELSTIRSYGELPADELRMDAFGEAELDSGSDCVSCHVRGGGACAQKIRQSPLQVIEVIVDIGFLDPVGDDSHFAGQFDVVLTHADDYHACAP